MLYVLQYADFDMRGFLKCELVEMSSIERILGYIEAWLLNEYSMLRVRVHVLLIYSGVAVTIDRVS